MRFVALTLLTFLFSCSSDIEKINESFAKKYQEEVDRINQQRTISQKEVKSEIKFSKPPTSQEIVEELGSKAE